MNAVCPSCGGALAKVPERKTKCPHCKDFMFVKYTPSDPVKRLVGSVRAAEIDNEWAAKYAQDERNEIADALRLPHGMPEGKLLSEVGRIAHREQDRHSAKMACAYLARVAVTEPERRQWLKMANAHEVLALVKSKRDRVVVYAGRGACPACQALDGERVSASIAIDQGTANPACPKWAAGQSACAFWGADLTDSPYGFKSTRVRR